MTTPISLRYAALPAEESANDEILRSSVDSAVEESPKMSPLPSEDDYLSDDDRERRHFMQDINKFMADIGKPLSKIPIMGYKELDLYQLFKEVNAFGGFNEVVKNVGTWSKIWKKLSNFDPSITDSSFRLKKNYERYLLEYEYKVYPERRAGSPDASKREPTSPVERKTDRFRGGKKPKRRSSSQREIARDKFGNAKMPLVLGELTIESLGQIIPKSPFITEKHVWPIGFTSSRYFSSMNNPDIRVKYTSKITDAGDKPQFVVYAEDDETNPIISHSPSGAWREVLKKANRTSSLDGKNISVSGTMRFGLAHPVVLNLLRELPNADRCTALANTSGSESDYAVSPKQRKRKATLAASMSSSDDSSEEYDSLPYKRTVTRSVTAAINATKTPGEDFELTTVFTTTEELEALESAVATLHALKYCTVF